LIGCILAISHQPYTIRQQYHSHAQYTQPTQYASAEYCSQCGNGVGAEAQFCPICGTKLPP
ncbi:MAG: zinc-ribbon domain-containing protein, partial [Crenarchaeota archaeon]|nr:zinc-ribbon domain-containing protein [Thermoproteota archaeon]